METSAYPPLSRLYALPPAEETIQQLNARLHAVHGVTGDITSGTTMAMLRLPGLTVWSVEDEFRWANGLRRGDGLPDMDTEPVDSPAIAADRVFERYQQVRAQAGHFTVRVADQS